MSTRYVAVWRDRLFIGPAFLSDPGTLTQARKAICQRIRDDKAGRARRHGSLWANKPVSKMQPGDSVDVHIGKQGYHLWACYYIEKAK